MVARDQQNSGLLDRIRVSKRLEHLLHIAELKTAHHNTLPTKALGLLFFQGLGLGDPPDALKTDYQKGLLLLRGRPLQGNRCMGVFHNTRSILLHALLSAACTATQSQESVSFPASANVDFRFEAQSVKAVVY